MYEAYLWVAIISANCAEVVVPDTQFMFVGVVSRRNANSEQLGSDAMIGTLQ
jgi:hypothetical protein